MNDVLVGLATGLAVVVVLLGTASTLARRRIGTVHLAGIGLLEVVLAAQVVIAAAALAGGHRMPETATFIGYLAGVLLIPILGVLWSRTEPTRWAGTVLAVAALVAGIMVWRLVQLWNGAGA